MVVTRWGGVGDHDRRWGEVGDDLPKVHNGPVPSAPDAPNPAVRSHRGWTVRISAGSACRFHDLDPEADTGHEIWIRRVQRPAVVFGSTQRPSGFTAGEAVTSSGTEIAPVEICRRRSGGGLVVVRPGDVWIDAIVPARSPLHTDDVGRAFAWFGDVWLRAIATLLADSTPLAVPLRLAEPSTGRRATNRPFFCFADVGHGEVLYGDRKIVGLSQRRTRTWTRLQSLFVPSWSPAEVNSLVSAAATHVGPLDLSDLGAPPFDAADVRAGFPADVAAPATSPDTVVDLVLHNLPGHL